MQKHNGRKIPGPGFAVEELLSSYVGVMMSCHRNLLCAPIHRTGASHGDLAIPSKVSLLVSNLCGNRDHPILGAPTWAKSFGGASQLIASPFFPTPTSLGNTAFSPATGVESSVNAPSDFGQSHVIAGHDALFALRHGRRNPLCGKHLRAVRIGSPFAHR